jgi:hypothetical protein
MVVVPILLVGAAMAVGLNRQPAPVPTGQSSAPQLTGAIPVAAALAQEGVPEELPASESNGSQSDNAADPGPGVSEAPAAGGTPVLTPPAGTDSGPAAANAGSPTPIVTIDAAAILNEPSIQTAITQFSNLQFQLPVGPGGQPMAPGQVTPLPPAILLTPSP